MAHIHILFCCILIGFAGVDLCFDSLILFDPYACPIENVHQIQRYYQRTRSTYIVQFIIFSIVIITISLLRCLIYRHAFKDYIALIIFVCLAPYYIFIMEPAEDACITDDGHLSEYEVRDGLYKVGIGHILIIIASSIIALLDLEWSFHSPAVHSLTKKIK
jgi:hypothetical protein